MSRLWRTCFCLLPLLPLYGPAQVNESKPPITDKPAYRMLQVLSAGMADTNSEAPTVEYTKELPPEIASIRLADTLLRVVSSR